MRRVFLGIDCGTQSTKVVLRDPASGEVVAVGRAPHELVERDDGTREQDPVWWTDALRVAMRDALRGERFDIGGIGVSGQQHGLVCLDRDDRPVRAAKLWNDTTTAAESAELTQRLAWTPACGDQCADASHMRIAAQGDVLTIDIDVGVRAQSAYPIPGPTEIWAPGTVTLDGQPAHAMVRLASGFVHGRHGAQQRCGDQLYAYRAGGRHDLLLPRVCGR